MSFKLSSELVFPWPVKVIEPHPTDAGKLIELEFTAKFAILDPDVAEKTDAAREAIIGRFDAADIKPGEIKAIQADLEKHDREAMLEILRGWDGITDDADKPLAFSKTAARSVCRHARIRNALVRAYREAISEDKARLGN